MGYQYHYYVYLESFTVMLQNCCSLFYTCRSALPTVATEGSTLAEDSGEGDMHRMVPPHPVPSSQAAGEPAQVLSTRRRMPRREDRPRPAAHRCADVG
jgi:hypothetical protein